MPDKVLVCDMDLTLIRVNSFPVYVKAITRELIRLHQWTSLLRLAVASFRRKSLGGSHRAFKMTVDMLAIDVGPDWYARWALNLYQKNVNRDVQHFLDNWDGSTLLSTAAPWVYAEEVGKLAGTTFTQASRFEDGQYVDNRGPTKVLGLAKLNLSGPDAVITDDIEADFPLIERASEVRLVTRAGILYLSQSRRGPAQVWSDKTT